MMRSTPSPKDIKTLSLYLDDQLNEDQKKKIELRLEKDKALSVAFENLRLTRKVLRNAPQVKASRSFLLSPEMVKAQKRTWTNYSSMRLVSSIASILFVVVFFGDFITNNSIPFYSNLQKSSTEADMAAGAFSVEGTSEENNEMQELQAAPLALEESEPVEMLATSGVVEPSADIPQEVAVAENETVEESAVVGELMSTPTSLDQNKQGDNTVDAVRSEEEPVGESADTMNNVEVIDIGDQDQSDNSISIAEEASKDSRYIINLIKYALAGLALTTWLLSFFSRRR